jgi:hypothetical protein
MLRDIISGLLEIWGVAFLGWSNGNEETHLTFGLFIINDGLKIGLYHDRWLV